MFGKSHKEIKEKIVKKQNVRKMIMYLLYILFCKGILYWQVLIGIYSLQVVYSLFFFVVSKDKLYRSKQRKEDKLIKILREIDFLFIVKNIKK